MKKYLHLIIIGLVGCAPMTPEASVRKDDAQLEQYEREVAYFDYKDACEKLGGYAFIERYGKAKRNQVIRKVPGKGDTLKCLNRQHKY